MSSKPVVQDRNMALWAGIILVSVGSYLLYDAYEGRGRNRPFWSKFIPI